MPQGHDTSRLSEISEANARRLYDLIPLDPPLDPNLLVIPLRKLSTGTYDINLNVKVADQFEGYYGYASATIVLENGLLVPIVDASYKTVSVSNDIIIDGSMSYDSDETDAIGNCTQCTFQWHCIEPGKDRLCRTSNDEVLEMEEFNQSVLKIPKGKLGLGKYLFYFTINKKMRLAHAEIEIEIIEAMKFEVFFFYT